MAFCTALKVGHNPRLSLLSAIWWLQTGPFQRELKQQPTISALWSFEMADDNHGVLRAKELHHTCRGQKWGLGMALRTQLSCNRLVFIAEVEVICPN